MASAAYHSSKGKKQRGNYVYPDPGKEAAVLHIPPVFFTTRTLAMENM